MPRVGPVAAALFAVLCSADAIAVRVSTSNQGQVLIYPYYTVRGGWSSLFGVVNASDAVVAVKVRFRESTNARPVLDFTIVLGPYDMWTGWITDGAKGPVLYSDDKSCMIGATVPQAFPVGPGDDFPPSFSGSSADFGPATFDRMREGYVEMIMLGADEPPLTALAAGALIESPNTSPSGCDALSEALMPTVAASDLLSRLRAAFDAYPPAPLKGTYSLVQSALGFNAVGTPTALEDFWSRRSSGGSLVTLQLPPGGGVAFADSRHEPTLAASNTPTLVREVTGATRTAVGAEAVTFSLLKPDVINEWTRRTEPHLGWTTATDWVITFPTKNFYVDDATHEYAGRHPERRGGVPIGPGPFERFVSSGASCELFDPVVFDREQRTEVPTPGVGQTTFKLCGQGNILTINSGLLLSSASTVHLNTTPGFLYGWLKVEFEAVGGLPIVGFAMTSRNDAGGPLSEAALYAHSSSANTPQNPPVPAPRILSVAVTPSVVENGDVVTASIACDADGLDVNVLFHAVDSQYVDGAESVIDRGGGNYTATWPISAGNRRANGTYALVVIATNSDGGSSIDRSASVTLSNVERGTPGQGCGGPDDCASGFCVGQICCASSCTGACMTCSVPGALGECLPNPGLGGCCARDQDCETNDPCSVARCDAGSGVCSSEPVSGCCREDASCGDGDPCTLDVCDDETARCGYRPLGCGDTTPCGADPACLYARLDISVRSGASSRVALEAPGDMLVLPLEVVTHATGGSLERLGLALTEIDERLTLAHPLRMRIYDDLDEDGVADDGEPLLGEEWIRIWAEGVISFEDIRLELAPATSKYFVVTLSIEEITDGCSAHSDGPANPMLLLMALALIFRRRSHRAKAMHVGTERTASAPRDLAGTASDAHAGDSPRLASNPTLRLTSNAEPKSAMSADLNAGSNAESKSAMSAGLNAVSRAEPKSASSSDSEAEARIHSRPRGRWGIGDWLAAGLCLSLGLGPTLLSSACVRSGFERRYDARLVLPESASIAGLTPRTNQAFDVVVHPFAGVRITVLE